MSFLDLKNFMDSLTDRIIPGNSVCVYHKNREVFRYSSGYSDVDTKEPMNAEKHINIYSCSKITTVVAAMQLVENGIIRLSDPLYKYIPAYKNMTVRQPNGTFAPAKNTITIENLFTMTSGHTYGLNTKGMKKAREITGGKMDTVTVATCIAEDPLAFEPGALWGYSMAHDVLAAVVEIASGKRFSDYVTENVFLPCGMTKSFYHSNQQTIKNMASQYRYETKGKFDAVAAQRGDCKSQEGRLVNVGTENIYVFGENYDSGGGGIITTVADYAKLGNVLANFGVTATGERILTKNSIEEIRRNRLTAPQLNAFNWSQLTGYGYGLGVRTLIDKESSKSNGSLKEFGWGGAAGATMLVDPDKEFSFFYAHHMLNPQEEYYQPRLRNAAYKYFETDKN